MPPVTGGSGLASHGAYGPQGYQWSQFFSLQVGTMAMMLGSHLDCIGRRQPAQPPQLGMRHEEHDAEPDQDHLGPSLVLFEDCLSGAHGRKGPGPSVRVGVTSPRATPVSTSADKDGQEWRNHLAAVDPTQAA
jgi:hypothetical protein